VFRQAGSEIATDGLLTLKTKRLGMEDYPLKGFDFLDDFFLGELTVNLYFHKKYSYGSVDNI
jgi:hypothetical protein